MTYGIIFWGNSPYNINIFRIQKRIIRIITHSRNRDSFSELFKNVENIFTDTVYFLFIVCSKKNKAQCKSNQEVHSINTRYGTNLHPPVSN